MEGSRKRWSLAISIVAPLLLLLPEHFSIGVIRERFPVESWSPYYRINYSRSTRTIVVNLLGHQNMVSRSDPFPAYAIPYLLNRDTAQPPFRDILIVGAGSGNDVSRALQWSSADAHIDAVEIDPVIQRLGKLDHPDKPYQDPRVAVHLGDVGTFSVRQTKNTTSALTEVRRSGRPPEIPQYLLDEARTSHDGCSEGTREVRVHVRTHAEHVWPHEASLYLVAVKKTKDESRELPFCFADRGQAYRLPYLPGKPQSGQQRPYTPWDRRILFPQDRLQDSSNCRSLVHAAHACVQAEVIGPTGFKRLQSA